MKKRFLRVNFALLSFFAIALLFAGCGKSEKGLTKIGVILPMTGDLASYGQPMKVGMEMAVNDLDSSKTLGAEHVKLYFVDSKADPTTAINGLQRLLNVNGIRYFIGDVSSPVTLALVPIVQKNQVFLLSPGASSPKLDNISPFFARNYPSSVEESIASAKFMFETKKIADAALVYVNSEYGLGLRQMFDKTFTQLGGKIVFSEGYNPDRTDFRDLIVKLMASHPEAIYLGGNPVDMGNFIRQLREAGSKALVVSNISFIQPDCLNIAGAAGNGVIVPVAYYNPVDTSMAEAHAFAMQYQEKFGKQPTIPNAVGYDAVMLIAKAISKVGNDPAKVASYIRNLKNYDGALGVISFTNGDVSMPMVFKVVNNEKVENLK